MMDILEQYNISQKQLDEIQTWGIFRRRVKRFKNKSTLDTFNEVFGENGERLIKEFRSKEFDTFLTYLTLDQHNNLLTYIVKNYEGD